MRWSNLLLSISLLSAPVPILAQDRSLPTTSSQPRVPLPGEFRHGELSGRCFRAGYMAGSARETCNVTIMGNVFVNLQRTSSGLAIEVTHGPCGAPQTASTQLPAAILVGAGRVERVAIAIRATVGKVMAGCAGSWRDPFSEADLAALLHETDNLEPAPKNGN